MGDVLPQSESACDIEEIDDELEKQKEYHCRRRNDSEET